MYVTAAITIQRPSLPLLPMQSKWEHWSMKKTGRLKATPQQPGGCALPAVAKARLPMSGQTAMRVAAM